MTSRSEGAADVVWDWSDAAFGLVLALPAAAVAWSSVPRALACAVGVVPAAAIGILPARKQRRVLVVVGVLAGTALVVGGGVANLRWLAVGAVFALSIGAVLVVRAAPRAQVVLTVGLPLVGVGLSYRDLGQAFQFGLLIVLGSSWGFVASQVWPELVVDAPRPTPRVVPPTVEYGVLLGLAAACAVAIGTALDLDHVGWACAAALLVMRPDADVQRLRSVGRAASVLVGAAAAGVLARLTDAPGWYGLAVVAVVVSASATHRSRWYLLPGGSTFLALSLLEYAHPEDAGSRWLERAAETFLGIGLAAFFGLAVPLLLERRRDPSVARRPIDP